MGRLQRSNRRPGPSPRSFAGQATAREFIEAWQSSESLREVMGKCRMRKGAVRVRALRYRKRGVPLKEFPPWEPPDWSELAEYAKSLLEERKANGAGEQAGGAGRP
jgi:hypothetical protein